MTEYHYTVTFTGRFPLDQLRYEWARPRQSADSRAIELSLMGGGGATATAVQLVALNKPSDRWRSFGCMVSDVSKAKV